MESVEKKKKDFSIHPRSWPGANGRKKDTSRPVKKTGRTFKYVSDNVLRRLSAHETTIKSLPSNVNPAAYRKPGSRNPSKLRQR